MPFSRFAALNGTGDVSRNDGRKRRVFGNVVMKRGILCGSQFAKRGAAGDVRAIFTKRWYEIRQHGFERAYGIGAGLGEAAISCDAWRDVAQTYKTFTATCFEQD